MATATKLETEERLPRGSAHLLGPKELFRQRFNNASFEFRHSLATHKLFLLDRLMELAQTTQKRHPRDLYYDAGDIGVNQRWDEIAKPKFSAADAIQRIENCGAWIALKHAEKDPEYRVVLEQCMAELEELTGLSINRVMKIQEVIMFITSPNRVTTYHIDRECSLLLQIQGDKQISIFDRNDRTVLHSGQQRATLQRRAPESRNGVPVIAGDGRAHSGELSTLAPEWRQHLGLVEY